MSVVNSYWRNGPMLNNAISGLDQALWDIKGKRAGMPVYQLLGGKSREAADTYIHSRGDTVEAVVENIQQLQEQGYRYFRCQLGSSSSASSSMRTPDSAPAGAYYDRKNLMSSNLRLFEHIRCELGFDIELMHDVRERLHPTDAVGFAKDMEQFKLFFLGDVLAPQDNAWFKNIRQQCSTPQAMGELFDHPHEWRALIENRLIDFMRVHVSQIGGTTPARNVAAFGNMYGVRTAWHGPNETSPVGTRRTCTLTCGRRTSASRNGATSTSRSTRCSQLYRKCATAICMPMKNRR
jgi:mannonate dehydratase